MSNDCIAECCGQVLLRCFLTGVIPFFDWLVMRRKESIIRNGRRIQEFLHLPECLQIFAKNDPGMRDRQLQRSSHVLAFIWLFQVSGLLAALGTGKVWSLVVLIPGVVIPFCLFSILYLWLVTSRRKLSASPWSIEDGNLPNPSDKLLSVRSEARRDRPAASGNSPEDRARTLQLVLNQVWSPGF